MASVRRTFCSFVPAEFIMKRIGILSDTHGSLNPGVLNFFTPVDEIWHAGDIGDIGIHDQLAALKPLRAVFGNMDGKEIRFACRESLVFSVEGVKVVMIHIGGYPGHYDRKAKSIIETVRPKLFVCGHSHILKVMYDRKYAMLTVNPGASGNSGFHHAITAVRFVIDGDQMKEMEVIDIPRK